MIIRQFWLYIALFLRIIEKRIEIIYELLVAISLILCLEEIVHGLRFSHEEFFALFFAIIDYYVHWFFFDFIEKKSAAWFAL